MPLRRPEAGTSVIFVTEALDPGSLGSNFERSMSQTEYEPGVFWNVETLKSPVQTAKRSLPGPTSMMPVVARMEGNVWMSVAFAGESEVDGSIRYTSGVVMRVQRIEPFARIARFSIHVGWGNWWIVWVERGGLRIWTLDIMATD